jgi:glycogen operon protein
LEWEDIAERDAGLHGFLKELIHLRQTMPILRQGEFLHGQPVADSGIRDVAWLKPDGTPMSQEDWEDPYAKSIGMLMCHAGLEPALLLLNAHHEVLSFRLPGADVTDRWRLVVDTASGHVGAGDVAFPADGDFELPGRALFLLVGWKS